MALLPKVKLKAVVSFPATVLDGTGIDVVKANGSYQFNLDFGDFAPPVSSLSDPSHQNALVWNSTTGAYVLVPVSVLITGTIPPSPSDTLPIVDGTALAGILTTYSRGDHVHPSDPSKAGLTQAVRYDAAQGLTANQKAQGRANIDALKKNYVLNGGMMVSQENGATSGTANGFFPVDMFGMLFANAGTQTAQQVASVTQAGSPNRVRITATVADASVAATDFLAIQTKVEGLRAADLRSGSVSAKTITIQFGCKGPAGTYCVSLGNSAANRSYTGEYVISAGEANTDVAKSVTVALDQTGTWLTDTGVGLVINFALMCGSTFQTAAGAWAAGNFLGSSNQFNLMGTNGNVFELFDVGLYEGVAPAFQVPDYASELLACQRYFEREDSSDLAARPFASGVAISTVLGLAYFRYRVKKRSLPTIAFSVGSTFAYLSSSGSLIAGTAIIALNTNSDGMTPQLTVASGLTAGFGGLLYSNSTTSAFINVNARL